MKNLNRPSSFFSALSILLIAFWVMPQATSLGQTVEADRCQIENKTFQSGEEVTYKIYYNLNFIWIPAGEVVFSVKDFGDVYQVSAVGRTYKSYEWFFKVRDRYESYIDKETLLPNMSVRDVKEGGYTLYDKTILNQEKQKATIERGRSKDTIHENKEVEIDNCMHDILSVIYYARNIDYENLNVGARVPIKIFMDKAEWPLTVKYDGKEAEKKIKGQGNFKTIKFSPEVIAGDIFAENTEMNIWVTDDKNKIPLLIESPVSFGSIKAVLKDYKGLKYDMTAAIEN